MKKFLCLILALCLVLGLCGCQFITKKIVETEAVSADGAALYGHSIELAELLEEMLKTPEYFQLMTSSVSVSEIIMPYMRSDLSEPESAYMLVLPEEALPALMNTAEIDMSGFSEPLREFMLHRMQNSVPTILNSQAGAEILAASSILTVSDSWPGETLEMGCYVLLMYPYSCPVMVSFYGKEGLIEGTATMLLSEPIDGSSLDAVNELFSYLDIEGMYIKELDIDND